MDDEQRLSAMIETRHQLEDAIRDIDLDLERAEHAEEQGRLITYIGERYRAQQSHFYELGKINAQIEDMELRARERSLAVSERDVAGDWEREIPSEDHIDWLRADLADAGTSRQAEAAQHDYDRAEERLLDDMHREGPDHEDHLEWFRPR